MWCVFVSVRREMSHPPPLLSTQNGPHITLGPHLRPPFLAMPSSLCQSPGKSDAYTSRLTTEMNMGPTPNDKLDANASRLTTACTY